MRLCDDISGLAEPFFDHFSSQVAGERIRAVTAHWKATSTSFWGFEIPLSTDSSELDFLFCIHDKSQFSAATQYMFSDSGMAAPVMEKLASLTEFWSTGPAQERNIVTNLWFEYDYSSMTDPASFPNFFFAPREGSHPIHVLLACERMFNIVSPGLQIKSTYQNLLKFMHDLGDLAWISQIGQMIARGNANMRLYVQGIESGDLETVLNNVRYPYSDSEVLLRIIENGKKYTRRIGLNFDLGHNLGLALGLEFYFNDIKDACNLLDIWVEEGYCTEGKSQTLKSYLRLMGPASSRSHQNFLSHLKLNFTPPGVVKTKAYIGWVANDIAQSVIRTKPIEYTEL